MSRKKIVLSFDRRISKSDAAEELANFLEENEEMQADGIDGYRTRVTEFGYGGWGEDDMEIITKMKRNKGYDSVTIRVKSLYEDDGMDL